MAELQLMPGLIRQEWESLSTILKILFMLYHEPKESVQDKKRLFDLCDHVVEDYAKKSKELQVLEDRRDANEEEVDSEENRMQDMLENELKR